MTATSGRERTPFEPRGLTAHLHIDMTESLQNSTEVSQSRSAKGTVGSGVGEAWARANLQHDSVTPPSAEWAGPTVRCRGGTSGVVVRR